MASDELDAPARIEHDQPVSRERTLAWANHGAPYKVRDSGIVKVACYIVSFRGAVGLYRYCG